MHFSNEFQQADLEAFRARIFNDVPELKTSTKAEANDAFESDDGLGYYADGVKRTLTDEQIAMFRNSEIYALLRERQVKQENKDAGFADEPADLVSKAEPLSAAQQVFEERMENVSDSDDEAEYTAFLAAEQKQIQDEATKNKRKRGIDGFGDERNRTHSTRRTTREMDAMGAEETVLDYGDSPQDAADASTMHRDELNGRKRSKYDHDAKSLESARKPAVEGRKIWWPTIGE